MKKIAVRTPNWLGDAVMSLPAIKLAVDAGDRVVLLTLEKLAPFYQVALPGLEIIAMRKSGFFSNLGVVSRLRAGGFERAILLTNSFSSALMVFAAGIPERLGYLTEGRGAFLNRAIGYQRGPRRRHLAREYLDLFAAAGYGGPARFPFGEVRRWRGAQRRFRTVLGRLGVSLVAFAPGAAYGPAKRWPRESFVELGKRLIAETGARVLLTGSAAEGELCREISAGIGRGAVSAAGETGLLELMLLLSMCSLVVSNDSGTMHLAAAMGIPVVALFGSSDPRWTAPLGERTTIIKRAFECSPCFKRKCERGYVCLTSISAADVLTRIREVLAERR